MGTFQDRFFISGGDEPGDESEADAVQPPWFGPPEDELGACLPVSVAIVRSERAVIALRSMTAYSTGVTLDIIALARGMRDADANRLFHDQHVADPDDLPDGFIRVGIEYDDQTRVSNLADRRRLWRADREPDGPVLLQSGGGGGAAGAGRVRMNPGYWLWPLPPLGAFCLFVEWPALDVPLSRTELDGSAIVEAARRSQSLWR